MPNREAPGWNQPAGRFAAFQQLPAGEFVRELSRYDRDTFMTL